MDGTARDGLGGDTAAGDDAASLVGSARQLRWRAPELALPLAARAAAADDGDTGGMAELLAAASLNWLAREVEAGHWALAGLRRVGPGHDELQQRLRVELAAAAVAVGAAGVALAVLRPVLHAAADSTPPDLRAAALLQLGAALTVLGRTDAGAGALHGADEVYRADPDLEPAPAVLQRGMIRVRRSARHRRGGEPAAAEAAAREGLDLLSGLSAPEPDGGAVGGCLVLELVLALLDRGALEPATTTATQVVGAAVRAAAAPSRGWLHLALATRVHLPAGRHREALQLLGEAVDMTRRHRLDRVLAACLDGLSRVHEQRGEHAEALQCLRSAHAAEYRHRRASDELRIELTEEFGIPRREVAGLADQLADLAGTGPTRRPRSAPAASPFDRPGFLERAEVLLAATAADRALSLVVVAVDGAEGDAVPDADGVTTRVAEQLQQGVPAGGLLGRLGSGRFAVLLPGADHAAALDWARRLRAGVAAAGRSEAAGPGVTISAGVAEYGGAGGAEELLARADRDLEEIGGRGGEPDAAEPQDRPEAPGTGARHRRDGGRQLPVAELLSAAGLAGRGGPGRRRAADPADRDAEQPADTAAAAETTAAPEPGAAVAETTAAAEMGAAETGAAGTTDAGETGASGVADAAGVTDRFDLGGDHDIGLGDLLAEALAAFEQGRRSDTPTTDTGPTTDTAPPARAGESRGDSEQGRGGEGVWRLPEAGRHSAAGD